MRNLIQPRVLVVTPARNEKENLQLLANSLMQQDFLPVEAWVIVDDGSSDGTDLVAKQIEMPCKVLVLKREKTGGLITGAAFAAWWQGVDYGISNFPGAQFVMKLDADVVLEKDYFAELFRNDLADNLGILGGVILGANREQKVYVPGPVKMYSLEALNLVRELPVATGFDVIDELACLSKGLQVLIIPNAKFSMNRKIGHSQGLLHGRYRNGLVCRWVGYAPEYFLLHLIRYFFRSPYFFGTFWMLAGYISSGPGPYPNHLRRNHTKIQRLRLKKICRHPMTTLRELYF